MNNLPDYYIDNLYEITKFMHNFFEKYNISYWLIGGSLIGALRNKPPGPIQWDDDIDVAILKKDEKKLFHAMNNDPNFLASIEWTYHDFGYQLRIKGDRNDIKNYYYDIFVYKKCDGPHGIKWYTQVFPDNYYNTLSEILPLQRCTFWDLNLYCPNNLDTVHRGYEKEGENVLRYGLKYNSKYTEGKLIDLWDNSNYTYLLPMLSSKLMDKLKF